MRAPRARGAWARQPRCPALDDAALREPGVSVAEIQTLCGFAPLASDTAKEHLQQPLTFLASSTAVASRCLKARSSTKSAFCQATRVRPRTAELCTSISLSSKGVSPLGEDKPEDSTILGEACRTARGLGAVRPKARPQAIKACSKHPLRPKPARSAAQVAGAKLPSAMPKHVSKCGLQLSPLQPMAIREKVCRF